MGYSAKLFVVGSFALCGCVNLIGRYRIRRTTVKAARLQSACVIEEAKDLLAVCTSASAGSIDQVQGDVTHRVWQAESDRSLGTPLTTGHSADVIKIRVNSLEETGGSACLTVYLDCLTQRLWSVERVYDVFCTLTDVLQLKRSQHGNSSKSTEMDCTNGEISTVQSKEISQLETLCLDTWNVFCAMANQSLSTMEKDSAAFSCNEASKLSALISLAAKRTRHVKLTRFDVTATHPQVTPSEERTDAVESVDSREPHVLCDHGRCVHTVDRVALDSVNRFLKKSSSPLYSTFLFARNISRFCDWGQILAVGAVSCLGWPILFRLVSEWRWDGDVGLSDLATRQAQESASTSFLQFAKDVALGYPGKIMALHLMADTFINLVVSAKDSFLEALIAAYRTRMTSDVIIAVSRLDELPDTANWFGEWETWSSAQRALQCATSANYFEIDDVANTAFAYIDRIATIIEFPLEILAGTAMQLLLDDTYYRLAASLVHQREVEEIEEVLSAAECVTEASATRRPVAANGQEQPRELVGGGDNTNPQDTVARDETTIAAIGTNSLCPSDDECYHCSGPDGEPRHGGETALLASGTNNPRLHLSSVHYGLSLLLLAVAGPVALRMRPRTEEESVENTQIAKRAGPHPSSTLWATLLLHTGIPHSPMSSPLSALSCMSTPLCEAALSKDGSLRNGLSTKEVSFFAQRLESLRSILACYDEGWSTFSPLGNQRSAPPTDARGLRARFFATALGDVRAGGWANVTWSTEAANDQWDSLGSALAEGEGNGKAHKESCRWTRKELTTPVTLCLDAFVELIDEASSFVASLVAIGVSSLYASRLSKVTLSEAVSLPAEMSRTVRDLCSWDPTIISLNASSSKQCYGQQLHRPSLAMYNVSACSSTFHFAYPEAVRSLESITSRPGQIDCKNWQDSELLPDTPWSVEFRDVSFRYPGASTFAVRNVSFYLPAGGFLGVIGYSGAGKSTLLLLLTRIFVPTSGSILLNGKPIERYPPRELRRRIGNVWQKANDFRFLSETSIEGNIALGNLLEACDDTVESALRKAEAWSFVASRGRGRHGKVNVDGLSGGEIERLNLARSFMKGGALEAGVFLLDECTSAMDSVTEERIMAQLGIQPAPASACPPSQPGAPPHRRGNQDEKQLSVARTAPSATTRIMVSHRLSSLRTADEILVLVDGTVVERGAWDELESDRKNVHFQKLLNAQTLVDNDDGPHA